jgi:hypothetical protein
MGVGRGCVERCSRTAATGSDGRLRTAERAPETVERRLRQELADRPTAVSKLHVAELGVGGTQGVEQGDVEVVGAGGAAGVERCGVFEALAMELDEAAGLEVTARATDQPSVEQWMPPVLNSLE